MSQARKLAAWVSTGRPVTAKGVPRRADVPAVAAALGVDLPGHVRSAADVEAIHHPWIAAQGLGMLQVGDDHAVATRTSSDVDLDTWFAGLSAVLLAESYDQRGRGAAVACRVVLAELAAGVSDAKRLVEVAHEALRYRDSEEGFDAFTAFGRRAMPADGAVMVLAEFGAMDAAGRLTSLGHWALQRLTDSVPPPATPDLPADEMLRRLAAAADDEDAWCQLWSWLDDRDPADGAEELLHAAAEASPAERVTVVDTLAGLDTEAGHPSRRTVSPLLQPGLTQHPATGHSSGVDVSGAGDGPHHPGHDSGLDPEGAGDLLWRPPHLAQLPYPIERIVPWHRACRHVRHLPDGPASPVQTRRGPDTAVRVTAGAAAGAARTRAAVRLGSHEL
ncbi:MAG: hypothetical protein ACRDN9_15830 [Streptosporangiaceae bacterium]